MSDPTPAAPRLNATLLLIATFALGMVAGAAILHIARISLGPVPMGPPRMGPGPMGPPPPRGHPGAVLERELDLDEDQSTRLRSILGESRERMRDEVEGTRKRIRELLTPEQRDRFDAMGPPEPMPPGRRQRPGPPPRPRGFDPEG